MSLLRLFKTEIILCLSIVGSIILLPVIALFGLTNVAALQQAPTSVENTPTLYTAPANPADTYAYGWCTYWAAIRRIQIGKPIPNTWGNAITWAERAALDGYTVDHTPTVGSILQDSYAPGGLGHVAFVEQVDPLSNTITISEMHAPNWDEVDSRHLTPNQYALYLFIH